MKSHKILMLLLTAVLSMGCAREADQKKPNRFKGLWSLSIMEKLDPETGQWIEWRDGMQGYILYDDQDNMAVHLTTSGYQDTDLRFPTFTDTISLEALKYLTNSYTYFAKYSVDEKEGTVQHARISHSNPGLWNEIVKRRYTFSGDTLILQPVEEKNADLRLKWLKTSDKK